MSNGASVCVECTDEGDAELEAAYRTILRTLGQSGEVLRDTPKRAAAAMRFMTSGYRTTMSDAAGSALFSVNSDVRHAITDGSSDLNVVVVKDIKVHSLCEHHLLPFFGVAHIGYVPGDGSVLGLSKLARITDMFARRLQMQERLTQQIAEAVMLAASPRGVAVVVECTHMCMCARGVRKDATTSTSFMGGAFSIDRNLRDEFWRHVQGIPGSSGRIDVGTAFHSRL